MENNNTLSGLNEGDFVGRVGGRDTSLCVLANSLGAEMAITNYGAKIVSLMVPDRQGKLTDVVTGHPSLAEYEHSEEPYFGSICGRYANRIANGQFTLDGVTYHLPINNGPNCLHGGIQGFNARVWDLEKVNSHKARLRYTAADGEEGFPGEFSVEVTYELSDHNEVIISYKAKTTKPTVFNLTNHSYFNLSGVGDPSILDHVVTINADYYLPTDDTAIPFGAPEKVEGTPMDFRTPHTIGERIEEPNTQLKYGRGYDHTFILNKTDGELSFCARCTSPKSGITMECHTTQPGVQLYTGNWMTGNFAGKNGKHYPMRAALCFETQHFPDSPNKPDYPSTVLRPGEEFKSKTIYRFTAE